MKLFKLRLTTLKSKLYAIVFASFVVRVVAFFALPNSGSNLARDEIGYAELTKIVADGLPVDESGYGSRLYLISRSLIVPAALLVRLDVSGIDSVRIVASVYGLLTLFLAVYLLLKLNDSRQEVSSFVSKNQKSLVTLVTIFALLPSHLIWSVLGLREAAMEFWVVAVFIFVFYVFEVKKSPSKLTSLGLFIAIPLVFSSRPQVGWVVGVTLLTYFLIKVKVRASQILIPITLIGIVSGYVATTAFSIERTQIFEAHVKVIDTGPSPTATTQAEFTASVDCKTEAQEIIVEGVKYLCEKKVEKKSLIGLKNPGAVLVDQADAIPVRNENNKVGAASVIQTLSCPFTGESRFDKYTCIAYRAPHTTYTFLFRPMLGADVTSSSSLAAAIENVFWLVSFLFVMIMFIPNRRLAFFSALVPSLIFFSIYTVAAGASEGNMGTAFRHKSLILWVVVLLLASTIVATQQRKAEQQGISGSS